MHSKSVTKFAEYELLLKPVMAASSMLGWQTSERGFGFYN